ncbi:MAG TPA: hypothetical protein VGK17_05830 [Propionicimonas sp.]
MSTIKVEELAAFGSREVLACSLCAEHITWQDGRLVRVLLDGANEQVFHPSCFEVFSVGLDLFVSRVVRPKVVERVN